MYSRLIVIIGIALLSMMLNGCTGTKVIEESEALQHNLTQPYSTVYILRERPRYISGLPDQPVKIEINGYEVGALSYSEYIMLQIVPTEGTIRFTSLDIYGAVPDPRWMTGEETFNFAAGQTNFIRAKFIDGEFRGAFFVPERIEFNLARELAKTLKPYNIEAGMLISDL